MKKIVLIAIATLLLSVLGPVANAQANSCKIGTFVTEQGISLGFPRPALRLKNKGATKFTVLFVDFADGGGLSPAFAKSLFNNLDPSIKRYFENASYGALKVKVEPHFTWLNLSGSSNSYISSNSYTGIDNSSVRRIFAEAVAQADPKVNFSKTDAVLLVINPYLDNFTYSLPFTPSNSSEGIVADGKNIVNGSLISGMINWVPNFESLMIHEILHNYGLVDLYDFGIMGPGDDHFFGKFSPMSHAPTNAGPMGWEKYTIGWVKQNQVDCISKGSKKVQLSPISKRGGKKLAIVPISANEVLVVETRRATANDEYLPSSGVLVYSVDTSIFAGSGPVKLLNDRRPLAAKKSVTYKNVTVTHNAKTGQGNTVTVKVN